jgi:hypothetical protein
MAKDNTKTNNLDPDPIVGSTFIGNIFSFFLDKKGYEGIQEVVSKVKNKGFTDGAWQAMMKSVGWKEGDEKRGISGQAWCAYYVKLFMIQFYSFDREWIEKNITGSAVGNFNTVQALNKKGDKRYITVTTNTPQIADIFCQGVVGKGHTGIVTEIVNQADSPNKIPSTIISIEGNTNLSGSREGDRVLRLKRQMAVGYASKGSSKKLIGYIRRNFTQEELDKLYFDEEELTLKFRA